MPGEVRNDLFVRLERGQFGVPGGKLGLVAATTQQGGRNIEVTLRMLTRDGMELEGRVHPAAGTGGGAHPQPAVFYHTSTPHWEETYRLEIPIDLHIASSCHLRLEYRHCSPKERQEKRLFGFSVLSLMEPNETVLKDGVHHLPIIRCEQPENMNPALYAGSILTGGSDSKTATMGAELAAKPGKEWMRVSTLLCSTKLTQNLDLRALLKWRDHPVDIRDILAKIMRTGGEEIVKFLQDILDALFAMFSTEEGNSTDHSGIVFQALLHILLCVQEAKFRQFQTDLDAYIETHFSAPLVYKGLLTCVGHCAAIVPETDKQDAIRKCFQSLGYVFKFIVRSRKLFAEATGGQNEDSFCAEVRHLFDIFNKMLANPSTKVLPTQQVFLKNLASIYPSIIKVMPVMDIIKYVSLTLDSLGLKSSQILHKDSLCAARAALSGPLWAERQGRGQLLMPAIKLVNLHLQSRWELERCTDIILQIVQSFMEDNNNQENALRLPPRLQLMSHRQKSSLPTKTKCKKIHGLCPMK